MGTIALQTSPVPTRGLGELLHYRPALFPLVARGNCCTTDQPCSHSRQWELLHYRPALFSLAARGNCCTTDQPCSHSRLGGTVALQTSPVPTRGQGELLHYRPALFPLAAEGKCSFTGHPSSHSRHGKKCVRSMGKISRNNEVHKWLKKLKHVIKM